METNTIIIAEDYIQGLFYSKKFKNGKEAIKHGEQIARQYIGEVITYLEEKNTGHRWEVDVIDNAREDLNISTLVVNSKKNAKLAAKALREYDDTLRIYINKKY